ncbi:MAG TPA: hypothetical protein VHW73_04845 [Rudaea sp.]|jgi:hypothetical protein|nr:hypothetical protein [Rudaea sp.]
MGNQSQQSQQDNRQQALGGEQSQSMDGKELRGSKSSSPRQSGDRNANEAMRTEGPEEGHGGPGIEGQQPLGGSSIGKKKGKERRRSSNDGLQGT